jgi:hypothetical protein
MLDVNLNAATQKHIIAKKKGGNKTHCDVRAF